MGHQLPPKKDVLVALLERSSVFVHLDPRSEDVGVPSWFKKQPELVLQIGLNMPVPIRDLEVDDEAVSCTLSFSRTPHFCFLPWQAIYALVSEDGRGMVWPEDIPPEVTAQRQQKQKKDKKEGKAAAARRKLRAVPGGASSPPEDAGDEHASPPPDGDEASSPAEATSQSSDSVEADTAAPEAAGDEATPEAAGDEATPPAAEPTATDTDTSDDESAGNDGKPSRRKSLPPYLRVVK